MSTAVRYNGWDGTPRAGKDRPFTADEFVDWMAREGWTGANLARRSGMTAARVQRLRNGTSVTPMTMVELHAILWANTHTQKLADRSRTAPRVKRA